MKEDRKQSDALKLLSRLMIRKSKWFRTDSLSYDEISDLQNAVEILVRDGILTESKKCGGTILL